MIDLSCQVTSDGYKEREESFFQLGGVICPRISSLQNALAFSIMVGGMG